VARRAAPVLAVAAALAALLLLAPVFPELQPPQRAALVAAVPPMALIGALAYLLAPLTRVPVALAALAGGGLLLTAITAAAGAHGAGTLPEAVLAIALGLLFARVFDLGAFVIGLPLVIGTVDLVTTLPDAAVKTWPMPVSGGDPLVLELPSWSAQTGAAEVSIATILFLAALQGYAVRERLRPAGTAVGMTVGLLLAYLLEWRTERAMPFTAFVAGGFLVASSDRLPTWLRAGGIERG
jgi:hypothetical protein